MFLVTSFVALVQPLAPVMRAEPFRTLVALLPGWIFAPRRTITGMLVAAGLAGRRHHAAFHRLFASARWSLDQVGLIVFDAITMLLGDEVVELTLDNTLARKRGLKIFGVGMHHDPLLSTRKVAVLNWGHCWVVLSVVVRIPCCPDRVFSLPILFRLYLNTKTAARWRRKYRKQTELAVEMLDVLAGAHPERRFHVLADSTYAGESVLGHLPTNMDMTSRLPMSARLHDAPQPRRPGQSGRPRKRGARLPAPQQMLSQRARRLSLNMYGRRDRVRIADATARWYGVPDRALRVVAVQPLSGGRANQAFYSTRVDDSPETILVRYSHRWSIEEAFQAGKSHLGFEEPQGWSKRSVERTAPFALLLYSLIVVWFARVGHRLYAPPVRPWYRTKARPSFADMLRTLRQASIGEWVSANMPDAPPVRKLVEAFSVAALAGP